MKKIGLIVNKKKDEDLIIAKKIVTIFNHKGFIVYMIENDFDLQLVDFVISVKEYQFLNEVEAIFCLGGDGTLLNVAGRFFESEIPLMGINLGHLGFLTEVDEYEFEQYIDLIVKDNFHIEERMMFEVIIDLGNKRFKEYCLNDFVISRGDSPRLINVKSYINDQYVDSFNGDGVIVSTPTGSTAYSLSCGGPIADPSMKIMLITPICPHNIYSRTFLVDTTKTVKIEVVAKDKYHGAVTLDGQRSYQIDDTMSAQIRTARSSLKLLKVNNRNFYDVLRKKLYNRGEE